MRQEGPTKAGRGEREREGREGDEEGDFVVPVKKKKKSFIYLFIHKDGEWPRHQCSKKTKRLWKSSHIKMLTLLPGEAAVQGGDGQGGGRVGGSSILGGV